jgi:dTDP-4-dehydrorhamnose 3,5-epimerase
MNDSDRVEWTSDAKRAFLVQSYTPSPVIDGVRLADLRRHHDDGGSMTELGRFTLGRHEVFEGFEIRQINYSEMQPGAIKAFHLHTRQTDIWYTPPSDRLLIVLFDARRNSPT